LGANWILVIGRFGPAPGYNGPSDSAAFNLTVTSGASGIWINWPAVTGKRYQVQFRDQFSADSAWQDLPGSLTVVGNTGVIQDQAHPANQRFYRIVAY
jgi:hypothetical protein